MGLVKWVECVALMDDWRSGIWGIELISSIFVLESDGIRVCEDLIHLWRGFDELF